MGAQSLRGIVGVKKGYSQTPEHIERKKRFGKDHHAWKGYQTADPRARARQLIKVCGPCELCGTSSKRRERHHKDGNPRNNKRSNLRVLCRECHMIEDGRIKRFSEYAKKTTGDRARKQWKSNDYRSMMIAAQIKSNRARKGSRQKPTDVPHCDSKTGVRGVYVRASGAYSVCLRNEHLGTFKTLCEARNCIALYRENNNE